MKIKKCTINRGRFMNIISVVFDDGSIRDIGSYYPDEVYYNENEFIGLTEKQADDLMNQRDKMYLQS